MEQDMNEPVMADEKEVSDWRRRTPREIKRKTPLML